MPKKSIFTSKELKIIYEKYFELGPLNLSKILINKTARQISSKAKKQGLVSDPRLRGQHGFNNFSVQKLMDLNCPFVVYFLGLLWADGHLRKNSNRISLAIVNSDFLEIKDFLFSISEYWNYRISHDGNPNHQPVATVEISNRVYYRFLAENDYIIKSGTSPDRLLSQISPDLRHYWWRGYFDGDGSIYFKGSACKIALTSSVEQDWNFLKTMGTDIGLEYKIVYRKTGRCKHSSMRIDDEANIRRFMDYIYSGEQFGFDRKRSKYQTYLDYKVQSRQNKTSQYRGVYRHRNKWIMRIWKGKSYQYSYEDEKSAARAYDQLAKELFGNKAVLNFAS